MFRLSRTATGLLPTLRWSRSLITTSPLPTTKLPYHGVLVEDAASLFQDASSLEVEQALNSSIDHWRSRGLKSVWLRLPAAACAVVPAAAACGFDFHHARGGECVMKLWLQPDQEDKIPSFTTHQVGCAGFVLNDRDELLVIKEWADDPHYDPLKSELPAERVPSANWKLPGGMLELGESFSEACTREVQEETGVAASFESILGFWNRHGLQPWGQSDFYVVCQLRASNDAIQIDPVEVSSAEWQSLEQVRSHSHPLMTHIISTLFSDDNGQLHEPLKPSAELIEGSVAWPNRPGFPTYMPRARRPD